VRDQEILDLLVVGGGPLGLATAIEAALQGMTVAVIEQRSGVIDKACGEGLMPPAVRHLREMGVQLPRGRPFGEIRYLANGRAAEYSRDPCARRSKDLSAQRRPDISIVSIRQAPRGRQGPHSTGRVPTGLLPE
jgi:2-polyprenyl-6-methoxyphenol hydroxylase-like FAD-dependent oxidoreductase